MWIHWRANHTELSVNYLESVSDIVIYQVGNCLAGTPQIYAWSSTVFNKKKPRRVFFHCLLEPKRRIFNEIFRLQHKQSRRGSVWMGLRHAAASRMLFNVIKAKWVFGAKWKTCRWEVFSSPRSSIEKSFFRHEKQNFSSLFRLKWRKKLGKML